MPLEHVDIPTPDGTADAIVASPDGAGTFPGVLLYMDAFGLRPVLEALVERIAGEGYVVLAPNVFHRNARSPLFAGEPDLMHPDNRAQLFEAIAPFRAALTPDAAMRDAGAYLDYLHGRDDTLDGAVGVVGYCLGGALALRTAAHYPAEVAAVASFHGGNLASDAPDSPHTVVDTIRAEVYVAHADNDTSAPPEQQRRLADALDAASVHHCIELYDGAAHGFTMADTAAYDEQAAERHVKRLLDLFRRTLDA